MKKLTTKLIVYSLVAIPLFVSCENNDPTAKAEYPNSRVGQLSLSDQIVLENADNYLTFSSHETFEDSIKILSKLDRSQLDTWEKSKKFSSLRRVFEAIVDHEIIQADIEEKLILKDPSLLKTMKHKISPLIGEASKTINFSLEDGVSYKIFDPASASVLNKDGVVKVGESILKYGEKEICQIVNGDESLISELMSLKQSEQTDNLKYHPVKLTSKVLDTKNARTNAGNELFCERTNGDGGTGYSNGDLKLRAWARGSFSSLYQYTTYVYWQNEIKYYVDMQFSRKTYYGSVNHRTESYSTNGTWSPGNLDPTNPPPGPNPFSLPNNFAGKASFVSVHFHRVPFITTEYFEYNVAISGTFSFNFVDIQCTAQ